MCTQVLFEVFTQCQELLYAFGYLRLRIGDFQVVRPSALALRSPLVSDDFPYLWQILCFTLWIL